MWRLLLPLLLLPVAVAIVDDVCPKKCICKEQTSITCTNIDDRDWPDVLRWITVPETTLTLRTMSIIYSNLPSLESIPTLPALEYLNLSHDNLTALHVGSARAKFMALRELDISYNAIENLDRSLFSFPALRELNAAHNRLRNLTGEAFRLFKLQRLLLNDNWLETISEHLTRYLPSLQFMNLSGNKLTTMQSSDFSSAQRLKHLDVSRNKIAAVEFDSFIPIYQLEELDLSDNLLSSIPGANLKSMLNLRVLNVSGNPVEKITAGDFSLPTLQILDMSRMLLLKVVEAAAFSDLPHLHSLRITENPQLSMISPRAFENSSLLFSLDISQNQLSVVFPSQLSSVAQVRLAGNPLRCGCVLSTIEALTSTTVADFSDATCKKKDGSVVKLSSLSANALTYEDNCTPAAVLPFGGHVTGIVGSTFSLFCSGQHEDDEVTWTLHNGTQKKGERTLLPSGLESLDYFSSTLYLPQSGTKTPMRPRIFASTESLRFDVLTAQDSGNYTCTIRRDTYSTHRKIELKVVEPNITLKVQQIGSHFASIVWSDSLRVSAVDRIALFLKVKGLTDAVRSVQISLHSPWLSYNVVKLNSNQNYTFCLSYHLLDEMSVPLLERCIHATTLPVATLWQTISLAKILVFFTFVSICTLVLCFRCIYARLHLWQQAKYRARMNQSLSGQLFISRSNGVTPSITFENSLQLCRVASTSTQMAELSNGTLLSQADLAL